MGIDPFSGMKMVIKDGRFGPYITDGIANASLQKADTIEEITDERASELLMARRQRAGTLYMEDGVEKWEPPSKKSKKKAGAKKAGAKKTAKAKKLVVARDLLSDMAESSGSMTFMLSDAPGGKAVEAMKAAGAAVRELRHPDEPADALASDVTEAKRSKGVISFTADISGMAERQAVLKEVRDAVVGVLNDAGAVGRLSAKRPD